MEKWVEKYVEELKKAHPTGIEIKSSGNAYYVYKSTTHWVKESKKRKKSSTYLGKLDRKEGFVKSSGKVLVQYAPRSIKTYGSVAVLDAIAPELPKTLKEFFPAIWQELYALAVVRLLHQSPIKRVASVWESLHNQLDINPKTAPAQISSALKEIGVNKTAQNRFFRTLIGPNETFAYDLSFIFTRSEGINFAEKGYNRFHLNAPQINLILLASVDEQIPAAIRVVPGSVRDIATLCVTIEQLDMESKTLILDRGFFADALMTTLNDKKIKYVIPAKRNSKLYAEKVEIKDHFFYNGRLIKCGMCAKENYKIFLFEDTVLRMEEENHFYEKIDKNQNTKDDLKDEKFGRILLVSNLDKPPEEIFLLYKQRNEVEESFDAFKNILEADKLYLQDNETLFGHIFVSFIALYLHGKLRAKLKTAKLLKKYSVEDALWEFSKIYMISDGTRKIISEVPKKVRILDELLTTNLFPMVKS